MYVYSYSFLELKFQLSTFSFIIQLAFWSTWGRRKKGEKNGLMVALRSSRRSETFRWRSSRLNTNVQSLRLKTLTNLKSITSCSINRILEDVFLSLTIFSIWLKYWSMRGCRQRGDEESELSFSVWGSSCSLWTSNSRELRKPKSSGNRTAKKYQFKSNRVQLKRSLNF